MYPGHPGTVLTLVSTLSFGRWIYLLASCIFSVHIGFVSPIHTSLESQELIQNQTPTLLKMRQGQMPELREVGIISELPCPSVLE